MSSDQHKKNLLLANKILIEDALDNNELSIEENQLLSDRLETLKAQLIFWMSQGNQERFCYDLQAHIRWMLKTFNKNS
jgi:hypothetical protein